MIVLWSFFPFVVNIFLCFCWRQKLYVFASFSDVCLSLPLLLVMLCRLSFYGLFSSVLFVYGCFLNGVASHVYVICACLCHDCGVVMYFYNC